VDNICDSLSKAAMPIQERMIELFSKVDSDFGKRVAKGLKILEKEYQPA